MFLLTITYYCEVGIMYIDILEKQIRNYQMNNKINDTKDGFLLNPILAINKVREYGFQMKLSIIK